MVSVLRQVLDPATRDSIINDMARAPMLDGRQSAGSLGQDLKSTQQVDSKSEIYRGMLKRVMTAFQSHGEFSKHAIPRRILPPLFARYGQGAFYKRHVDNALMGPFPSMRTDLSITIFLNDPDAYDGGTLSLETPFGVQEYRLEAGDAILYPTHYPHWVTEVTRGERLAVVTWIESLVKDPLQRDVAADLADLMEWAIEENADQDVLLKIEKTRLNLMKMWANT